MQRPTWLEFFQAVFLVLGVYLYFYLRDKLADFLTKDGNQPRSAGVSISMAIAKDKVSKDTQPMNTRHTLSKGLIIWALVALPLNLAAFWVPNVIWIEEHKRSFNGPYYLLVLAVPLFSAFPACTSYCVVMCAWLLPRQRTSADAEEMQARLRRVLLDAVLLPPLYALWVAYQFSERHWELVAASPLYQGQTIAWMRFFWQLRRESLERTAAAVAHGSNFV